MKTSAKHLLCTLTGLALSTLNQTQAANVESRDHPYKFISATNVFRLKTLVIRPEQHKPPKPPPPTITLQGITTICGQLEALFKVAMPAKPPESVKEIACVLTEGEREGEIEVLEINVQSGTVKFSNHGVVQVLALK